MSKIDLSKVADERAKEDIAELHEKIQSFRAGKEDEEKFRSFRLARGVYGQRQEGVQMIRIKLPYGKMNTKQFRKIADVADKYATEKMHATTRQDIQIHYVKMDEAPMLWAELEEEGITLKEACGNTVRNVTGAPEAGVDPKEPFDITPYAHSFFLHFLRNPICQEMGRKFKAAFSTNDSDNGFAWLHDVGFLPKIQGGVKGFEVRVAGGLGSQPVVANVAYEFLPADQIIPFSEAVIRVFDRYGERASRGKARLKFLVKNIGFDAFMELVEKEKTAVIQKVVPIDENIVAESQPATRVDFPAEEPKDVKAFEEWRATNVFEQKQEGLHGVYIKLTIGDIFNETVRRLTEIVDEGFAADDIRVTVNQGLMLRHVRENAIIPLFNRLYDLDLTDPGFGSTADIMACPGTDTCNLGIASSTGIARELERLINEDFHELIYNNDIKIKISGCMNACGHHNAANIGFQGMSIKKGPLVMPAMQLLLGGGFDKEGNATVSEKVVKLPSKRVPAAFGALIEDFETNKIEGEYYNNYYRRQVEADKMYFFHLMKPYTSLDEIPDDFYTDWGNEKEYVKEIGVGECAGVVLDLVGTLIEEAKEKFAKSEATVNSNWQDSIYHSYNTFVVGAKALLLGENVRCNTHIGILQDFDTTFVETKIFDFGGISFEEHVTQLNRVEPSQEFAEKFHNEAKAFIAKVVEVRANALAKVEA